MRYGWIISWVVLGVIATTTVANAQIGGIQVPSGLSAGVSKDALLEQAKSMVGDLTSMKSSGKLGPAQMQQVDTLLPKAQSLTGELEQPQLDATRLPALAGNLSDLQKQVGVLKGFMR